jgi:Rrf2 family protein
MQNSRFAVAIHTLVLLAAKAGKPTSSDYIAGSVGTNPVLIRRLMGELRAAGIVDSRAGATGGFVLAKPVERIGLDEIYRAVEDAPLFARHENANPACPIGRAVGPLLDRVLGQAEGAMLQSLKRTTLADLLRSQEVVTQLAG